MAASSAAIWPKRCWSNPRALEKDEKRTLYSLDFIRFISQPQILVGHGRAIPETRSHPRLCAMTKLRHLGLLWTSPWGSQGDFHPDPWWHWRYCDRFLVPWYLLDCPGISTDLNRSEQIWTDLNRSQQFGISGLQAGWQLTDETSPSISRASHGIPVWHAANIGAINTTRVSLIYLDFLLELLWFCHKCCHLPLLRLQRFTQHGMITGTIKIGWISVWFWPENLYDDH